MNKVKLTIRLDEKTHKALKVKTAQKGTTIQEVLKRAVDTFLEA